MHRTEAVVRQLRRECAFNAARVPPDLIAALLDELGELSEAIEGGAGWKIADELGDVLFCVLSLAAAIEDVHGVTVEEADERAARKMIDRHPYVFGDADDPGPDLAPTLWEDHKLQEELANVRNRAAVIGTGIVTFSETSAAGELAEHVADVLCRHLAPFGEGAAPPRTRISMPDGRSVTVWFPVGGNRLTYCLIGGPATDPTAAVDAVEPLAPIGHTTHLQEVTHV